MVRMIYVSYTTYDITNLILVFEVSWINVTQRLVVLDSHYVRHGQILSFLTLKYCKRFFIGEFF